MKKIFLFLLVGMFLLSFTSAVSSQLTGLTNYYKAEDTSGALTDNSVVSNNLTAYGNLNYSQTGLILNAVSKNGNYANRWQGATTSWSNETMSMSIWFKGVNQGTGFSLIGNPQITGNNDAGIRLFYDGTNIYCQLGDNAYGPNVAYAWTYDTNWHNVVGTWTDYGNGTAIMSCYVDNDFKGSQTWDGRGLIESQIFYVGAGGNLSYTGEYLMDEIGIWNRTLNKTEISQLYNNGYGLSFPFLVPITSTVTSPANLTSYLTGSNISINFNITSTGANVTNATLFLMNVRNQTLNLTGQTNASSFPLNLPKGSYFFNVQGCELASNCANSSVNHITIADTFINSISYDSSIVGSSVTNITANISSITTPTLVYLNYNGTNYSASITNGGAYYILSNNISVPPVTTDTNITFFYYVIWTGNITALTSYNQTITTLQNISVSTTCAAGFYPSLNFTFYKEVGLGILEATTIDYNFQYGAGSGYTQVTSGTLANTTNFTICINSSLTYVLGYGEIDYSITGYSDRRYYLFNSTRLVNSTTNTSLYALDSADSTPFQLTATTTTLDPYVDHYISLLRWYPSINEYKIVEMGKTDDNGQTVVNVKTNDVDYRLGLYEADGTLVKLLNPIRMVCQTTPCVYSIITTGEEIDLTTFLNVEQSLTFNETTKIYTFIWNDPSQTTNSMNLLVWKDSGTESTLVCNQSANEFTGILTCDVSAYTGIMRAEAWRTASPANLIAKAINEIRSSLYQIANGSGLGLFFGFLLTVLMATAGVVSPPLVVILVIIGLIPMAILGNISFSIFMIVGAIGGVTLHFLRRSSQP